MTNKKPRYRLTRRGENVLMCMLALPFVCGASITCLELWWTKL